MCIRDRSLRVRAWIHDQRRSGGSVSFPFHGNGDSRSMRPLSRSTPITDARSTGNSFAAIVLAIARTSRSTFASSICASLTSSQYVRMRDGLAREFPEAGRAIAWTRARIGPRTEPVVWAAISGIGAGFVVSDFAQVLVGLASQALLSPRSPASINLFPLVPIAGSVAAVAVALVAGGGIALALVLAYTVLGIVLRIPSLMAFCERSGPGQNN